MANETHADDERTATIYGPASVWRVFRDACGVVRQAHRKYDSDSVNKEAATKLRKRLADATEGFNHGATIEVNEDESRILWSGLDTMKFDRPHADQSKVEYAANCLTYGETHVDGEQLPIGCDVWDLD